MLGKFSAALIGTMLLSGAAFAAGPFPASGDDYAPPTYLRVGELPKAATNSVVDTAYFDSDHMQGDRGSLATQVARTDSSRAAPGINDMRYFEEHHMRSND